MSDAAPIRAGFVAVVGRPNVGKSTLVNALVGRHVAIVSRRPQTTRRRILGVANRPGAQLVLVDSPGLHGAGGRPLNRALNASARRAAADADAVLLVAEAAAWDEDDARALAVVRDGGMPVVLALNKIDLLRPRSALLPLLEAASARHDFAAVVPVAAARGENIERLASVLTPLLPPSPLLFPPGEITDLGPAERAAEFVREALIERLGQELPYATYVTVGRYAQENSCLDIEATIWVARESQKGIVIGAGGRMAKAIGTAARRRLEAEVGGKVMLRLWVRVRAGWDRDPGALAELGIGL
ncbi:MAG TPA: GTPase Era [Gammaproteobacteria bacterium]|nr:GTPase Era [Gammaproteobacteria bacterium]